MEKLSKVLIFAEKESQFGLLCSAAKSIAEHTAAFAVASAPACPVDKAFVVADQGIVFDDYFETFAAVTAEYAPDAIIFSSEKRMRSIAARIAAVCKTAVIADVNAMEVAEGKLYCSHLVYGGAAVRCESSAADTTVVVLAPGSFEDLKGEAAEKESVDFAAPAHPAKFVERREKQGETVNLSAAKRAVGIGRGLAKQEDLEMVYNGDIKTAVNKVIGAEHFDKEYVDYVNALKYSWGGTTVKLAVDGHLTDLKMLSQFGTLDQEKFYEDLAKGIIPEEVNFFMSNPSNYSKSAAPEGKQMICFTCPHQLDLPEEIEARLVDKMMVTAEKYIPGLSEHIIIKEVLFNSDIMTASGKGGAGIGIGQVAGQTGAYRPKIKLPVEGAYVVGAAAGGAGVGTELAVNSAIEFFDNYCK